MCVCVCVCVCVWARARARACVSVSKCIFKYNQQDATLHNLFISVRCSTCFRLFLCPLSGAQNCVYSIRYIVKPLLLPATTVSGRSRGLTKYQMLYIQFWAPDDGRRNRLKHVEHLTEINELCNGASCWLYLKIRLWCVDPWTSNISKCLCLDTCDSAVEQGRWWFAKRQSFWWQTRTSGYLRCSCVWLRNIHLLRFRWPFYCYGTGWADSRRWAWLSLALIMNRTVCAVVILYVTGMTTRFTFFTCRITRFPCNLHQHFRYEWNHMFSYYVHLVIAQSAPFMFFGLLQPAAGFLFSWLSVWIKFRIVLCFISSKCLWSQLFILYRAIHELQTLPQEMIS